MSFNKNDLQAFESEYNTKEQEILVLFSDVSGGASKSKGDLWSASAYFLAFQDLETGKVKKGDGRVVWAISDSDLKKHRFSYPYFFKHGEVYRLSVRSLLDRTVPDGRSPSFYNRFLVVKVLEENVKSDALSAVWEEYKTPVVLKDNTLGEFELNKHYANFDGNVDWHGNKISVHLEVDCDDKETWSKTLDNLRNMYERQDIVDSDFRRFAAEKLTELANDWLQEDDDAEIKQDDFAGRIRLVELSISADGDYSAYYHDDDMFLGHSVTVCGNIESGINDANIEG